MTDTDRARATHLVDLERYADARLLVRRLLATEPDDADLLCLESRCHLGEGDHFHALLAAERAVAAAPHQEFGFRLRASALTGLERHEEAVDAAAESRRLAPHLALAHLAVAEATRHIPGRRPEALAAAHRAVALSPDDADAHHTLAMVAHDMGDRRLARASYRRALSLAPDDGLVMSNLATTEGFWRLPSFAAGLAHALRHAPNDDVVLQNVDVLAARWMLGVTVSGVVALVAGLLVPGADDGVTGWSLGILGVLTSLVGLQTWVLARAMPAGMRRHVVRRIRQQNGLRVMLVVSVVALAGAVAVCAVPGGRDVVLVVLQVLLCLGLVLVAGATVVSILSPRSR